MLSELGASQNGNSGLVSSSNEPHLKLVTPAFSGTPVERTKERLRTRISAVQEDMGRAGTAQVLTHTHPNPRGHRAPQ